jgi:hypothetical protein
MSTTSADDLERQKFELERSRYRTDLLRWIIIAAGAIVSFAVIDYGKLRLEQFQAKADSQRQLLEAYLLATEAPEPDMWKRKLHVLVAFADDERLRRWALDEFRYIDDFAARDALYREALKVASQLIEPSRLSEPERAVVRARFNQLYWADLPFARESPKVASAMVAFRNGLLAAEAAPGNAVAWSKLNGLLISLSKILRDETPPDPRLTAPGTESPQ